jgi:hypothetical protein
MPNTPFRELSVEEKASRFLASRAQNLGPNVHEVRAIKEFVTWCKDREDESRTSTPRPGRPREAP